MKKFRYFILILLLIPCFLFGGCDLLAEEVYVTNISKGTTIGSQTTYTITYSDGTTSTITVENGKDGKDLTLEVIEKYCEEQGITLKEYFDSLNLEINSIEPATNKALQSAVSIIAVSPKQSGSTYYSRAGGAGVIYKMDEESNVSYVITNYHVVESNTTLSGVATEIKLFQYGADMTIKGTEPYTTDGTSYYYSGYTFSNTAVSATYVGGSNTYDIAILKVETDDLLAVNPHACPVTVANGYRVANTAIAIGNPNAAGMSVTQGIVSVESEYLALDGISYRVMRVDTAVNPGNSGGGLFNINGELIGIVNAKMESATIDNIAYALPYNNATKVAENIIYYHEQLVANGASNTVATVKRLYLNIEFSTENSRAVYDTNTETTTLYDDFVVQTVTNNGVGDRLGLQKGDKVTTVIVDGKSHTLRRSFEFVDLMLTVKAGSSIEIKGNRGTDTNITLASSNNILASQLSTVD